MCIRDRVTLMHSDLLAMVPMQWLDFAPSRGSLTHIPVREALPAPDIVLIRRAGAALTPAATFLLELMCKAARDIGPPAGKHA